MARVTNLRSQNITAHRRQVKTYGTQTPLSSAAVERGSTRWLSGSHVEIQGTLSVTGTATVGGTLSVTGIFNASGDINLSGSTSVTGPMTISGTTMITGNTSIVGELVVTGPTTLDGVLDIGGDTTITGALDITGDTSVSGALAIEGVTTLKNDLNVEAGGRIKAGQVEIHPDDGGNIGFENGGITSGLTGFRFTATGGRNAIVESVGGQAQLVSGSSSITARAGAIDLESAATHVSGTLDVGGRVDLNSVAYFNHAQVMMTNLPTSASQPNVYISASGRVYRSTWTP